MRYFFLIALNFSFLFSQAQKENAYDKYRVVIMTDMTHEDGNSLIRYLYYSPYFDTEAIIVTQQLPDFKYDQNGPWIKVNNILDAYQEEYSQLKNTMMISQLMKA